jgi:hypothetical protein
LIRINGGEPVNASCCVVAPDTKEFSMAHESHQKCIDACDVCAQACDHCATACLEEPDVKELLDCIRLDLDCADICRMASAAMSRGGPAIATICNSCAEVCEMCAIECEKHRHMEHCRACAEACRKCAEECRRMASMARTSRGEAVPA